MNILITGGLGFVGINLVRRLAETLPETRIVAADILPVTTDIHTYLSPVLKRIAIRHLDTRNRQDVLDLCHSEQITHILHAAAITPAPEMESSQPGTVMDVNLGGTVNILHAFHVTQRLRRLILCSSTAVYDPTALPPGTLVTEDAPLCLKDLYSITKFSSELLGTRVQELTGRPVAAVRLSSVYGPMERPTGARRHMSLMLRLKKALQEHQPVCLFGPDVTRDWIHTADVARGLSGLLTAPAWNYPVYNLGSGTATPLSEITAAFSVRGLDVRQARTRADATLVFTESDSRGALDISRIRQDAGFSPTIDAVTHLSKYLDDSQSPDEGL
jgi:UDP-glucose 4-epimerase